MAQAIRQSVDLTLARGDHDAMWDRARAIVGRYGSRRRDGAARHDAHLARIWKP